MTLAPPPKLSIGLPVYNGEQYLRQAIDSILNQSFTDFELIISDNASTDYTPSICQEFLRRDSRVRYYHQTVNLGAAENFNFVFRQAHGEYFKWSAHDDVLDPEFFDRCITVLDQEPSVLLCYSKVNKIDPQGNWIGTYDYDMRVNHAKPHIRFHDLILINHFCIAIFGIIRREELAKTPLIGKFIGSDRTLLAELSLRGRLYEVPAYLFSRRDHPLASTRLFKHHDRLRWFDPRLKTVVNLPYWNNGFRYLKAVSNVPLPAGEKAACFKVAASWFWERRSILWDDVKVAILSLFPFIQFMAKRSQP